MHLKPDSDVANVPRTVVGVPLARCRGRIECGVGRHGDSNPEQAHTDSD